MWVIRKRPSSPPQSVLIYRSIGIYAGQTFAQTRSRPVALPLCRIFGSILNNIKKRITETLTASHFGCYLLPWLRLKIQIFGSLLITNTHTFQLQLAFPNWLKLYWLSESVNCLLKYLSLGWEGEFKGIGFFISICRCVCVCVRIVRGERDWDRQRFALVCIWLLPIATSFVQCSSLWLILYIRPAQTPPLSQSLAVKKGF